MPKLSIIIPVYNAEEYLAVSVGSIINQTFSDWELILVNDGSKDNSLRLCQEYSKQDFRIKVIDKKNGGAGPARNAGLEIASGTYIAFVDADDWLDPTAYADLIPQMEKTAADILLFGVRTHICDANNEIIDVKEECIQSFIIENQESFRKGCASLYQKVNMDSLWNKIYKARIIKENALKFPDLRRMQDGVFNMSYYACVHSMAVCDGNYYNRRWNYIDVQQKKMPKDILSCALVYYKTAMQLLNEWGYNTKENHLIFLEKFVELLHVFEFIYLPLDTPTFKNVYRHIKHINGNAEVHQILREYKKAKGKLRRKEKAMLHRWNFLLAIVGYRQIKNGGK
ncbi:MAG: glycosyltransferase family 2 protein [Clostridia bacterium]|nr:glycosyltransferase family 2 protein [Clostridia bacterium]